MRRKVHTIITVSSNDGIIYEVKLVPEAQPRDTNGRVVLFPLSTLGNKHILMARSLAEGPIFKNILVSYPQIRPKGE